MKASGLIVIVIRNKIFHRIVWKELFEFGVERAKVLLCAELIWSLYFLDNISKRFTRTNS
jgi:hypothetical protein